MRAPTPAVVGEELFGITSNSRRTNPVETKPARGYELQVQYQTAARLKGDILPDSVAVSDTDRGSKAAGPRPRTA